MSPCATVYRNESVSVRLPELYSTALPVLSASVGAPVTTTGSLNATVTLTMSVARYGPLAVGDETDWASGAVVSITMSFWEPSEPADDGAGRLRLAGFPIRSAIDAPAGRARAAPGA